MKHVQLPDERWSVLSDAETIEQIERRTGAEISLDDELKIARVRHDNSIDELTATDVIEAAACGFQPHVALRLLKPGTDFVEIDIKSHTRNKKALHRQKGRLIGKNGRTKQLIQELAGVQMTIQQRRVFLLGDMAGVTTAREAIERLISGAPHSSVYAFLEQQHSLMNRPSFVKERRNS